MRVAVAIALSLQPASAYVKCHGSHSSGAASPVCPDANTCIISPASGTFLGCCPSANATACPGGSATSGSTCCPFGSTCSPDGRRCNLPGTPPPPPPVKPIPMSSGAWQPAWNTCSPAVSSSLRSPGFLEVVSGSGLTIPVYSQPSSVAYGGDVTKLASPTATFVLIMQHGAARNGDMIDSALIAISANFGIFPLLTSPSRLPLVPLLSLSGRLFLLRYRSRQAVDSVQRSPLRARRHPRPSLHGESRRSRGRYNVVEQH